MKFSDKSVTDLLAVVALRLPEHGSQSQFQCLASEKHQCLWCEALWNGQKAIIQEGDIQADTKALDNKTPASTLTSAFQESFGLQVHFHSLSFGGVSAKLATWVGRVRQHLWGQLCANVQSLCAASHFLSLY